MTREQALPYVAYIIDDALNVTACTSTDDHDRIKDDARFVGWQCGFEPLFVAVQSYLPDVQIGDEEAEEIARDYLAEINWLSDPDLPADYII